MNRKELLAAALAGAMTLVATPALSQTAGPWRYQATLYGYLPSIGGSTSFPEPAGGSVTVDADKIVDSLKFAFMGSLEANNGRWGMLTDIIYMDLGTTRSGFRDFSIGGSPLPAGAEGNLNYDLKGWAWTLAGTWRAYATPSSTLDVLAGARMFDIEQKLAWEVTGNVGSISQPSRRGDASTSLTNWDAIIGVKGRLALGDSRTWFVPYYLDVGTGDSDLTWQAMGGLGYSFGWGDVIGAWRYLDYDMKSDSRIQDMTFNGPAIAVAFRW